MSVRGAAKVEKFLEIRSSGCFREFLSTMIYNNEIAMSQTSKYSHILDNFIVLSHNC